MPNVQFSADHICDQNRQRLSRTARGTNGSREMNGDKLRTVDVVQQTDLADSFQRGNKHRLGQDSKPNAQTDIDGCDEIVPLFSEATGNGLCHHNRCCFTIVLGKKEPDVVSDFVPVKVFDEEFFSSSSKICSPRDFYVFFVVVSFVSRLLGNDIGFIRSFIEPLMVSNHFRFQTDLIHPNQRVVAPDFSWCWFR